MEKEGVQSLDRAFTLLELLCKTPGGLAIHQITQITGLHKSTVHRMLSAMAARGYVRKMGDGVYRAGMRVCELSDYVQQNLDVVELAREPMERLSRRTGETVHLVERDGDEVVNLRRNQRHPIWCKSRRMKRNGKSTGRFFSVTASCQQTPNSSKSLCKCYRRH